MTCARDLPAVAQDKGLVAALEAQARKAAIPTTVEGNGIGRFRQDVEAAVYFSCLEALQQCRDVCDARRDPPPRRRGVARVHRQRRRGGLRPGATGHGTGLQGIADRLAALGGEVEITSTPGAGTTISVGCRRALSTPRPHVAPDPGLSAAGWLLVVRHLRVLASGARSDREGWRWGRRRRDRVVPSSCCPRPGRSWPGGWHQSLLGPLRRASRGCGHARRSGAVSHPPRPTCSGHAPRSRTRSGAGSWWTPTRTWGRCAGWRTSTGPSPGRAASPRRTWLSGSSAITSTRSDSRRPTSTCSHSATTTSTSSAPITSLGCRSWEVSPSSGRG